ncbi:MAG: hypothetical protein NTX50_09300 [Candidatus Sumerlaeota bacterium]|nr:hypothetical protein [Candidatus Sumerlaeota bacterium]
MAKAKKAARRERYALRCRCLRPMIVQQRRKETKRNGHLEQPFASAELDFEYGSAMFFSQIVNDAHRAVRLSFWPAPQPALIFELQGGNGARVGARISYFVDQSKRLWRTTGSLEEAEQALASEFAPGAAGGPRKNTGGRIGSLLMENVEELSAKQNAATGRWRIVLRAAFERYERRISLDRHADIALGKAWAGAKP